MWGRDLSTFLFVISVFVSAQAQSYEKPTDFLEYTYHFKDTQVVQHGVFAKVVPKFEDLYAQRSQFRNYEEFLDYLLLKAPSLKSNFVLVHRSESQQPSSLQHPRILLFDGGVVFGISEHPAQKQKRVEILQAESGTFKVSLNEIIFDGNQIEFRKQPSSCTTCHGSPAKPLWNPYDFWPNTFGSAVGNVGTQQEKAAYAQLVQSASQSAILKRLHLQSEVKIGSEAVTAFTEYIHQINMGRWITENIQDVSDLQGFDSALLAALSLCTAKRSEKSTVPYIPLWDFFHESEKALSRLSPEQVQTDVQESRRYFKNFLDAIVREIFPNPQFIFHMDHARLEDEVPEHAHMHWALNQAGLSTGNLSTSLFANPYLISSPSLMPLDFLTSLYAMRPQLFAGLDIEPMDLSSGKKRWIRLNCSQLQKRSLASSRQWAPAHNWTSYTEVRHNQPVISRCATCHVENMSAAPFIPFHDPLRLAQLIQSPTIQMGDKILQRIRTHGSGQMPPDRALSPAEVLSFEDYLKTLKSLQL